MKSHLLDSIKKEEEVTHARVKDIASKFDRADQAMGVQPEPAVEAKVEPEPAPAPVAEPEVETPIAEAQPVKPKKTKKPKPVRSVRDTFSMPETDYELITKVMDRNPALKMRINKSEILRAGILALSKMSDGELKEVFGELNRVRAGRPVHD
jgi:hypothetical protein